MSEFGVEPRINTPSFWRSQDRRILSIKLFHIEYDVMLGKFCIFCQDSPLVGSKYTYCSNWIVGIGRLDTKTSDLY